MKPHPTIARLLARAALPVGVAVSLFGCKGPDGSDRVNAVDLPDQAPLVVQWVDGPRKDNASREIEKQAARAAAGLFRVEPMSAQAPEPAPVADAQPVVDEPAVPERPTWADGVEQPADSGGNDLPQGWPIEVRRGETPAVLAEWANVAAQDLITANSEGLGGRKWFKVGDRVTVTMSANDKVAFDRKRESFQKGRVDAYFANRYFKSVIVYRVKKGEFVASAAKRYGDVPLWLIEEFNQMDFRGLQPGDEILIPVVGELPPGVRVPPPPVVVDEEGHALSEARSDAVEPRLRGELFAKARMALDDSNVFKRPRVGGDNLAMAPEVPLVDAVQGANYPRPEQVLPPASIGGGILPRYAGNNAPAPVQQVQVVEPMQVVGVEPAAPAVSPDKQTPRDVIVRRGESLMHYVMWSKTPLDVIKTANPGRLDADRIFIGARVSIPMSDDQYVQFVTMRAEWDKQKLVDAEKPAPKAPKGKDKAAPKGKTHVVKSGETATSIARASRITVKQLKEANPGVDLKKLRIGVKLSVPPKQK